MTKRDSLMILLTLPLSLNHVPGMALSRMNSPDSRERELPSSHALSMNMAEKMAEVQVSHCCKIYIRQQFSEDQRGSNETPIIPRRLLFDQDDLMRCHPIEVLAFCFSTSMFHNSHYICREPMQDQTILKVTFRI